jgi:hypothetical protein
MPYFRGKPCCDCLAEWLPWFEKVLLAKGIIRHSLDVYQLIGGASASAGTHRTGGAFDLGQFSWAALRVARDMGADADWDRLTSQGFSVRHSHGVLRGCPHNGPARYQIVAVDDGYNGLGYQGRGGRDNGPRPLSHRSWEQGIVWAKQFLAGVAPKPESITFTALNWNIASPKWFPHSVYTDAARRANWDIRNEGICKVIADIDPDVLFLQESHFSYMTADILAALGRDHKHQSSPVGNDIFYRDSMFDRSPITTRPVFKEYPIGPQGRALAVLHVVTKGGLEVALMNTHAPALVPAYRTTFGNRVAPVIADVEGVKVASGDWNTKRNDYSPRKQLRAIGLRCERDQMDFVGEDDEEHPGRGWLCGTYTQPSQAKIVGGRLHMTSPKLADHRPFSTRIEAHA